MLTLDDEGKLRLSYMGTDPPMNAVDIRHGAEVDYAVLENEYREVASQIKAVGVTPASAPADDQLIITAQVPHLLFLVEWPMLHGACLDTGVDHNHSAHSPAVHSAWMLYWHSAATSAV